MSKQVITFVTSNLNKFEEVKQILKNCPFEVVNQKLDLNEYQGEEDFISIKKCQSAAKLIHGPVLIEDTSLHLNALNGLPGPYIKYFMEKLEKNGLPRLISSWDDKSALAQCTVAFVEDEFNPVKLFKGTLQGSIVNYSGNYGFGWDFYFVPQNYHQTLAELETEVKNKISHRYKAFYSFRDYFLKNN